MRSSVTAVILLLALSSCAAPARVEQGAEPAAAPPGATPAPSGTEEAVVTAAETTALEPYVEEVTGTTVSFEMIPVPEGSIRMETSAGTRTVEIEPFWMSETEVLWDLYDVYTFNLDRGDIPADGGAEAVSRPSKPYVLPGESFGHQGMPALSMTYHAAQQFMVWLSAKTGHTYRLPTEAEWEYACRLGQRGLQAPLEEQAWYWDNAQDRTHPPGERAPNALGLYDMLGNVAEWVAPAEGEPVVKGGSWRSQTGEVDCGARQQQTPAWNATDPQLPKSRWWLSDAPFLGLRLVREP